MIGMKSSISSSGASSAGTAIRQKAFAAMSRANCSAAASAASFAASDAFFLSCCALLGGGLKASQQYDCKPPLHV